MFVGNPDGPDVELQLGDRIGAVVPAAVQTQACGKCGLVDTDAFINDLTMCEFCGTLLPAGPTACRRCGSGPEEVEVRLKSDYDKQPQCIMRQLPGIQCGTDVPQPTAPTGADQLLKP